MPRHRRPHPAAALALVLLVPLAAPGPLSAQDESEEMSALTSEGASEDIAGFDPGSPHPDAPDEIDLFGRLAGAWNAQMWMLQGDGTFSEEPLPALWTFRYILDGHAIQDEWTAPPPGQPAADGPRQHGTGLRVFNPAEERWEIAWISNTQPFVTTFEARPHGDGGIVMLGEHALGYPSRTTFHHVEADSFSWTLEFQGFGDDPDAWTEVARIRAVRAE